MEGKESPGQHPGLSWLGCICEEFEKDHMDPLLVLLEGVSWEKSSLSRVLQESCK